MAGLLCSSNYEMTFTFAFNAQRDNVASKDATIRLKNNERTLVLMTSTRNRARSNIAISCNVVLAGRKMSTLIFCCTRSHRSNNRLIMYTVRVSACRRATVRLSCREFLYTFRSTRTTSTTSAVGECIEPSARSKSSAKRLHCRYQLAFVFLSHVGSQQIQEAQLSPRDRAMRRVS